MNMPAEKLTKLKVCHLVSGDLWAGAEVMALYLLRGLNSQPGIDLFVILLNKGRLSDELDKLGISTLVIDESKQSFPRIIWLAAQAIKKRAPHILHSHRYKENIISYFVSKLLREKASLVSTQHGMPEHYDVKPSLLHQLKLRANYRLLATQFDKTVAVSADIKKSLMRDYGIPESRLETIHNGIAVPEYQPRSVKRDEFVIGSAGRFFPVKDYPLMVEVANEVCAKTDEIRFELAGEGPMQEAIQSLISKHGLEKRFLLRGFISDVDAFCRQLDVYINTSLHEGIPMSVLEAMAHGVPPILPKVGGLEEIVTDGVDGYLVATRSPQEFADRCLSLFRNEELRRNMARAAREKVIGEFSIERMIHAYVEMYRQLIENSGQRKHQ